MEIVKIIALGIAVTVALLINISAFGMKETRRNNRELKNFNRYESWRK